MNSLYMLISFILSLMIVYITKKIAIKTNFVDKPNERKMHKQPKPLLGGVAIYLTILIMTSFYGHFHFSLQMKQLAVLSGLLVLMGMYDDKFDMKAWHKLICQLIISGLTAMALGGITSVEVYSNTLYFTKLQGIFIEMAWFVVLINAFNLIDGLDGLSTGVGIISFATILIIALVNVDMNNVIMLYIIIGTLFGFLFYNFYPSTIFLGDAGAMFIGYLVALLSINDYKTVTITSSLFLFLVVFLPVLDVTLSFVRRKVNGSGAFKADALHFHHRLMRHGYSHQQAVLLMYGFMAIYSAAAIGITIIDVVFYKALLGVLLVVVTIVIVEKFYLLSDRYAFTSKFIRKLIGRSKR